MARRPPSSFLRARFRSAPRCQLVRLHQLSAEERGQLDEIGGHARLGGVLRLAGDGLGAVRVVDRDAVRLISSLRMPSHLPGFVLRSLGREARPRVAGLVLEGVLEIEHRGRFLSGLAAHSVFFDRRRLRAGRGRLARLSRAALVHAASLYGCERRVIAARLYCYNTVPASPEWRRRLPDADSVRAFLRCDRFGDAAVELLDDGAESNDGWLFWHQAGHSGVRSSAPMYKLYVSPVAEYLPEALRAAQGVLGGRNGAVALKVGRSLHGVLRSDKLVAYFRSAEDLRASARRLRRALSGMKAQGVPFTAAVTPDGLLSWGLDPPATHRAVGWSGAMSWRSWLTYRLAGFLATARATAAAPAEAHRFALDRLSLDGVDPVTWTPESTVWADTAPGAG